MRGQGRTGQPPVGLGYIGCMSLEAFPVKTVVKVALGVHGGGRAERPVLLTEPWAAGWLSSSTPVFP